MLKCVDQYAAEKAKTRPKMIKMLLEAVEKGVYEEFCQTKDSIISDSFVNDKDIRDMLVADNLIPDDRLRALLEGGKAEAIPGKRPNWIDPVPENWGIDPALETAARPGACAEFGGAAVDPIDVSPTVRRSPEKLRCTYAMPLICSRLYAKLGLMALENDVDPTGVRRRVVPLYRYRYLRKQALALLDRTGDIEKKMTFLQQHIDDFAELVASIERPMAEKQAELAAIEGEITTAVVALTNLASVRSELQGITNDLDQARDDCDVEWWESLLGGLLFVVMVGLGTVIGAFAGAGIGFLIGGAPGAEVGFGIGAFIGFTTGALLAFEAVEALGLWGGSDITCDNVDAAYNDFHYALGQVARAIQIGSSELEVAMARRDLLQAQIASLSSHLQSVYADDAARHLDADTLQNILGIYEDTRRGMLDQATIIARKMEASYRFEHAESWCYLTGNSTVFIADEYQATEGKGYGAREQLLKDIEALEFERLNGRTHKAMQLTLPISLRLHFPATLAGIKASGKSAFTLSMERMDRFYPGTYQHRIKEVRVDALADGVPSAVRGYLSCYGPSQIRFPDPGNQYPVDDTEILSEPDQDIAKLCYKRARQVGGREQMAFPDPVSPRSEDRMLRRQLEERNFFENLGMGVTWVLEVLPDQTVDMARLTDFVVTFQVEAEYDDNLRKVVEGKRFKDRDEISAFSARQMMERQNRTFDPDQVVFDIHATSLPYPFQKKTIKNIAVFLKPKTEHFVNGVSKIVISQDGNERVAVKTDEKGRAATGLARHAGPDGGKLENAFHGKDPAGRWSLMVDDLPPGVNKDDITDMYLLLRYAYV